MNKLPIFLILSYFIISINSCDPGGTALIEITNNTPYDLKISFMVKEDTILRQGDYENIEIKKDETVAFSLINLGAYHRNPNYELESIILTDINTGEVINELNISEKEVFELVSSEIGRFYHRTANFSLTIP